MIPSTVCCQWVILSFSAILVLPAIHLASAGIAKHRGSSHVRRPHNVPSPSDSSAPLSASSSLLHSSSGDADQFFTPENVTPTALPYSLQDSNIELPEGFKFVGLDGENKPFIIIPNMHHLLENNNDLMDLLISAMKEAHRTKRSVSSSSSSSTSSSSSSSSRQCHFDYKVTVRRTGRCVRFGDYPACLSGGQLYPFARGC